MPVADALEMGLIAASHWIEVYMRHHRSDANEDHH
jgi:hypothetical protein